MAHRDGVATVALNRPHTHNALDDAMIAWPKLPLGGGVLGPLSVFSIGVRKAKELSFQTGSDLTGLEAAEIGWAHRAAPAIAHTDPGVREVAQLVREIGMKASIERFGA
jgi:enoyl-CoA hydratase